MAKTRKRASATKRPHTIQVRLSTTEREHVRRCAATRNVTVSEYARTALILGRLT